MPTEGQGTVPQETKEQQPAPIHFDNVTLLRERHGETQTRRGVNIRLAESGSPEFLVSTPDGEMAAIIQLETLNAILKGEDVRISI